MRSFGSIAGFLLLALACGCPNVTIPYREEDHASFDEEFAPHQDVHGWWYVTGYASDVADPTHLYAFQFTQVYVNDLPLIPRCVFAPTRSRRHEDRAGAV